MNDEILSDIIIAEKRNDITKLSVKHVECSIINGYFITASRLISFLRPSQAIVYNSVFKLLKHEFLKQNEFITFMLVCCACGYDVFANIPKDLEIHRSYGGKLSFLYLYSLKMNYKTKIMSLGTEFFLPYQGCIINESSFISIDTMSHLFSQIVTKAKEDKRIILTQPTSEFFYEKDMVVLKSISERIEKVCNQFNTTRIISDFLSESKEILQVIEAQFDQIETKSQMHSVSVSISNRFQYEADCLKRCSQYFQGLLDKERAINGSFKYENLKNMISSIVLEIIQHPVGSQLSLIYSEVIGILQNSVVFDRIPNGIALFKEFITKLDSFSKDYESNKNYSISVRAPLMREKSLSNTQSKTYNSIQKYSKSLHIFRYVLLSSINDFFYIYDLANNLNINNLCSNDYMAESEKNLNGLLELNYQFNNLLESKIDLYFYSDLVKFNFSDHSESFNTLNLWDFKCLLMSDLKGNELQELLMKRSELYQKSRIANHYQMPKCKNCNIAYPTFICIHCRQLVSCNSCQGKGCPLCKQSFLKG